MSSSMMSSSGGDSEFSTPNESQRTSCILSSPTSCASLYYSANDFQDLDTQSDCTSNMDATELISKEYEPHTTERETTALEELNGLGSRQKASNGDQYFSDGLRSIDFVLVYRDIVENELAESWKSKREIFHQNLISEGVEVEVDSINDVSLKFVKLHASYEVCTRYAEILKLRLPMKKKIDEAFLKDRLVFHIPGIMAFELSTPVMLLEVGDFFSKIFNFVRVDSKIFPPKNKHFTAIYSRNKEYLFEINEDIFTPAIRSRILDFILRRKKFTEDETDVHSVGIEKLLSESVYDAAYPIHDGELLSGDSGRAILYKNWACLKNFYKYQPLDHIKDYFGVKIGLYFAWLGFYTYMLIPASIVGLLCFLYAVSTINLHEPSECLHGGHSGLHGLVKNGQGCGNCGIDPGTNPGTLAALHCMLFSPYFPVSCLRIPKNAIQALKIIHTVNPMVLVQLYLYARHTRKKKIQFCWVLSHVVGNEIANDMTDLLPQLRHQAPTKCRLCSGHKPLHQ